MSEKLDPAKTAVVVVDMWDYHPCKAMADLVDQLATPMNEWLGKLRERGVTIVFAPAFCRPWIHKKYEEKYKVLAWGKDSNWKPEKLPNWRPVKLSFGNPWPEINASSAPGSGQCMCVGGPSKFDDDRRKERKKEGKEYAQYNQSGVLSVHHDKDYILNADNYPVDSPDSLESPALHGLGILCVEHGITNLLYAGVATNMCVFAREYGVFNAHRWGFNTHIISDMTRPYVTQKLEDEWKTKQKDAIALIAEKYAIAMTAEQAVAAVTP